MTVPREMYSTVLLCYKGCNFIMAFFPQPVVKTFHFCEIFLYFLLVRRFFFRLGYNTRIHEEISLTKQCMSLHFATSFVHVIWKSGFPNNSF